MDQDLRVTTEPPRQRPRRPSPWGAAAAAALVAVASVLSAAGCGRRTAPKRAAVTPATVIPVIRPVSLAELDRYAGSAACAPCHPKEAGQLHSRHARTLARVDHAREAARFRRPGRLYDPFRDTTHSATFKDGKCVFSATRGADVRSAIPEYVFGSGNRGVTYTGRFEGQPVEMRLSYYDSRRLWEFTPGQKLETQPAAGTPVGRRLSPRAEQECFQCHVTALAEEGGAVRLDRSILGVGCEACHGPGKEHIAAVKRGDRDHGMARLADRRDRISLALCGQCHRNPASSNPGDPMTMTQLPRLQGVALSLSPCFQKSGGRLSCVTCHNPHRDADRTSHDEYNADCRGCHRPATPGEVTCTFKPAGDCVHCHMPAQPVDMPTRPRFRTHWIDVWDER